MRTGHLYKIVRKSTGEYYYGIHKGLCFDGYWGSGIIIRDYIKTHGTTDLEYNVLVIGPYDYIIDIESKIVTETEVLNEQCWNLKTGGYRGIPGEKTRALISASGKGRKYSSERTEKIQKSRESKKEEIYKKVSESNLGKIRTPEQCKRISDMKKEKMSHETKNKLRLSKLGTKNPSWKGYIKTPDGYFTNTMSAAKYYNMTNSNIGKRCRSNNPLFKDWERVQIIPDDAIILDII
jgi:hypothetical protein